VFYIYDQTGFFKRYWDGAGWKVSYKSAQLYYTEVGAHRAMKDYQGIYRVEAV
jgi:hypothetical protein